MAEEKLGRPKTLVRRHVLEIKEDTRDWLGEQLGELKQAFLVGKATRSAGEVLKGAVSHPVGFALIAAPIVASVIALLLQLAKSKKEEAPGGESLVHDLEAAINMVLFEPAPSDASTAAWINAWKGFSDWLGQVFTGSPPAV